ncbi:hypothetical protein FHS29_000892 [Saccharothrix tamanrassetensis]|uniref:Secreted protein n=1 Tax=Saccharothrix tamanrassetensis TaxID=1051531 RepID=A0A841C730_9PSEU|nr:hypothetical protein [Saccharothrix tamanrassetensis]MBB5954322.1 hypothetical protein [Saccharothrix tamanrassetensis]
MKSRKSLVVVFSLALMAITGGMAQAAGNESVGALDTSRCVDLANGRLCITITPVNRQGHVRVSYQKKSGGSFYGHLEWVNPANQTFRSPDVTMSAGNTYYHTWPTWVGPGCNRGVVYNVTDRESSPTPPLCV